MLKLYIQTERLQKLTSDIFITDNPTDIVNLFKNKPKPYRVAYDKLIDKYMICDANSYIHMNMVGQALKQGYYDDKDIPTFLSILGVASNASILHRAEQAYWSAGTDPYPLDEELLEDVQEFLDKFFLDYDNDSIYPWIYCVIFQPTNTDFMELGEDGYDREYQFSYGTVFTRDFEMGELPELQNALKRVDK